MTHADLAKSDAIGAGSLLRHATIPCLFFLVVVFGCAVPPAKVRVTPPPEGRLSQVGIASWYGPGFHGKATTSGAIYNQYEFTAAHQTLPLGTRVMVTNLETGSATEVTINDRGPFAKNRIIDLSYSAAEAINMIGPGTALVRVDIIDSPTATASDSWLRSITRCNSALFPNWKTPISCAIGSPIPSPT